MTTLETQATLQAGLAPSQRSNRNDSPGPLAVHVGGPSLALLGTSSQAANLRNTTVLPKVEQADGSIALRPCSETRYQRIRRLGAGAMGEVTLVKDNDIGRTVAVKRCLSPSQSPDGIARFIEEIRTIGQLEHPNIVPIHDVGIDEQGQLFFVMKHIEGETLEAMLEKLAAGDQETCARYTIDVRIEIFMGLLHALQCAHERGIIHRDREMPWKGLRSRGLAPSQETPGKCRDGSRLLLHVDDAAILPGCLSSALRAKVHRRGRGSFRSGGRRPACERSRRGARWQTACAPASSYGRR